MTRSDRGRLALLIGSVVLLCLLLVASLLVGERLYDVSDVVDMVAGRHTDATQILNDVRVPRTLLALVVGAALALAGTLTQTVTRNPLADPGMLGVSAGAGFAIGLASAFGSELGPVAQLAASFVGSVLTAVFVYAVGHGSPLRLVLAGVAVSSVLLGITLTLRLMFPTAFDAYRSWSVGSIAGREQTPIVLPVIVLAVSIVAALLLTRSLAAMALGEQTAHALGSNVVRLRIQVMLLITLLTAAATAAAGPIAFLGLIVPTLARPFCAGSVGWMVVFTTVWGPVVLVASDILARVALPGQEIPVSVVMAFLGGMALVLAVRDRKVLS